MTLLWIICNSSFHRSDLRIGWSGLATLVEEVKHDLQLILLYFILADVLLDFCHVKCILGCVWGYFLYVFIMVLPVCG